MLRLGAEANRRGVVRYDGGYFALNVRTHRRDGVCGHVVERRRRSRRGGLLLRGSGCVEGVTDYSNARTPTAPRHAGGPVVWMEAQGIEPWSE